MAGAALQSLDFGGCDQTERVTTMQQDSNAPDN